VHPRLVLPAALRGRPFTVDEALAHGLSRADLRSPVLRAPFRGVRVAADLQDGLARPPRSCCPAVRRSTA